MSTTTLIDLSAIATDEDETATTPEPEAAPDAEPTPAPVQQLPPEDGSAVPAWALVPSNLRPPRGKQVIFVRIPAEMTDAPAKGERQAIIWTLSDGDERMASDRCKGEAGRASAEYTKQMLRAVDGTVVDWSKHKGPGSIDEFWREVGPKGRNLLTRLYAQLHMASDKELSHFFESCIAVRSTG